MPDKNVIRTHRLGLMIVHWRATALRYIEPDVVVMARKYKGWVRELLPDLDPKSVFLGELKELLKCETDLEFVSWIRKGKYEREERPKPKLRLV